MKKWRECSGDPMSCPENEGYGCCAKFRGVTPAVFLHQWRPIETVPHDETVILANFTQRCLLTGAPHVWTATYVTQWCDLKTGKAVKAKPRWNECSHAATNENGDPTHWMHLPELQTAASGSPLNARSD